MAKNIFAMSYVEIDKLHELQNSESNPTNSEYLTRRQEFENSIMLDEKDNCYSIDNKPIYLIIRINKTGVVDNVLSNEENDKAKCFRKVYLGSSFDAPPNGPIYVKKKMGLDEADRIPFIQSTILSECKNGFREHIQGKKLDSFCNCMLGKVEEELTKEELLQTSNPSVEPEILKKMEYALQRVPGCRNELKL